MVRPKIERRIVKKPDYTCLQHGDISREDDFEAIKMNLDEFEAIRLGDYHNIKQKEAAELMGISQPTFHRIINSARKKTAMSLIEGKKIEINNENFYSEDKIYICKNCGFQWNNPKKEYTNCPDCKSENIEIIKNLNDLDLNKNAQIKSSKTQICDIGEEDVPLNERKSFGGPGSGRGPSKACECPNCGYIAPKIRGFPCRNIKCPECGTPLCGSKHKN
ncbi:DUF134 domain-containing protein [Methanobrevibacter sp.]|uniref:DUF134 domain-containing protein n=1 Tax=Methanobrevibacter sp. TaxID=66852 RepID=UPI0025E45FE6|nr:DUF134 domain-containing protein [Methanobrevibacter sp.]MBQ2961666.1 DUF134 domain-containing protein [Methanobrevibacter sp.]